MAMLDTSNIIDLSTRSRRSRHDSGKNVDADCDRTLELSGIVDVLSAYSDYEGGINCSKCAPARIHRLGKSTDLMFGQAREMGIFQKDGKLYKSRVCFIKHLWEHSVYWKLFPDTKNHERVLSIQAALILYSRLLGVSVEDAEKLMDLLVTSPNVQENTNGTTTPKKSSPKKRTSPQKLPRTPGKKPRIR